MFKSVLHVLATCLSIYYSFAVHAADAQGRYWIFGVGRQTCSTYLEARKEGGFAEISYKNWVSGYLTADNQVTHNTYNILADSDFDNAMIWLDRYCQKNSHNTVYMGMANLTVVMYPARQKAK